MPPRRRQDDEVSSDESITGLGLRMDPPTQGNLQVNPTGQADAMLQANANLQELLNEVNDEFQDEVRGAEAGATPRPNRLKSREGEKTPVRATESDAVTKYRSKIFGSERTFTLSSVRQKPPGIV